MKGVIFMENNYNNNFNSGSPYSYNQTNQQTGDGTNTSWSSQVNGNTSQGYSQGTQGLVENHYNSRAPLPPSLALVRKRDKTVIKTRKIIWDAYNIIAWVAIFLFGGILLAASLSDEFGTETGRNPFVLAAYIIGILGILASVWVLFRKDKIVIKPHKIIIVHKFMLFSRKNNELVKDDIESIDVAFTPATERYFVAISSDNKTMVFGKKLPIEDLRWVRQFLINDVVSK